MSFFKRANGKIIFFTKNSPKYFTGEYSLILSPQFYWVKRVKLPVKSEYKAKKLAPSIFEGTLPKNEDFLYDVMYEKDRETFIVIAYSVEYIYQAIKSKMAPTTKIRGIYFAQYELAELKTCIAIDEEVSLGNVDGLLIQVPSSCVHTDDDVRKYLPSVNLSSKRLKIVNLEDDNNISNYPYYYIVLGLFLVSQIFSYLAYSYDLDRYDSKKSELLSKYSLPRTSFELNSIKKSLSKRLNEQKAMKNILIKLDSISLNKGEKFISIMIDKKEGTFHIKTTKQGAKKLLKAIKQKLAVTDATFTDGILTIKVSL